MLSQVVGQSEAVRCLHRVVEGKLTSPLLLIGEEGVGRRTSVLAAIREILVVNRGADSSEVYQLDQGVHPDITLVVPEEGKELGVDAVRDVVTLSNQPPTASPLRFLIVEGADRMTNAAANAILKTLEEPADFSRFFLLAESYNQVIPTIRSRCGRVDYRKLPESFIFERLSRFEKDADKALVYSRLGEGSVGKAARYWGSNRIAARDKSVEVIQQVVGGDFASSFSILDGFGKDLQFAFWCLVSVVHDLLLIKLAPSHVVNVDIRSDLEVMFAKAPISVWSSLWDSLRTVWVRNETTYVNLSLQIKAALAAAFVAG